VYVLLIVSKVLEADFRNSLVEELVGEHQRNDEGDLLALRRRGWVDLGHSPNVQQREEDNAMRDLCEVKDVRDKVGKAIRDSNTQRVERLRTGELGSGRCCCWR